MDRAPDFGSVGSGFDSWLGHLSLGLQKENTTLSGGVFLFSSFFRKFTEQLTDLSASIGKLKHIVLTQ